MDDFKEKAPKFPPTMSEETIETMKKIIKENADESKTFQESCEETNKIIENASEKVKSELVLFKKQDCSKTVLEQYLQEQKE
jgi:histone H3/H4